MEKAVDIMFDNHWKHLQERCNRLSFPLVQDKGEMQHVYNLVRGCKSYLEVGTAEGNSLYVMGHALLSDALVVSIDWQEPHTKNARDEVLNSIPQKVIEVPYDSHTPKAIDAARSYAPYDVVFIDAGHKYDDVVQDAKNYGIMATKYIIFHDIVLPEVYRAFRFYCSTRNFKNVRIYSSTGSPYGYGIITL